MFPLQKQIWEKDGKSVYVHELSEQHDIFP